MRAIRSVKEVFESDLVIITKISKGYNKMVRIDAKTRFHVPDKENLFSKWISLDYANRLSIENYNKTVFELNVTQH